MKPTLQRLHGELGRFMGAMGALSRGADAGRRRIERLLRRQEPGDWNFVGEAARPRPVFVLSTGRTGTTSLATLLAQSPLVDAQHEPAPRLLATSYAAQQRVGPFADLEFLQQVLRLEREPAIVAAHRRGQVYFEGANRMTFLAEALQALYPHARFLMVTRHPLDFIRSAQRRSYYTGHPWDLVRAHPREGTEMAQRWAGLSAVQKISWLWAETYRISQRFMGALPSERRMVLRAEQFFDWDMALVEDLFRFVCDQPAPGEGIVRGVMDDRLNAQLTGQARTLEDWSAAERQFFVQEAQGLAEELGYDVEAR